MSRPAALLRDPEIVRLAPDDAEGCRRLSALAGWSHERADWQVRLAVGRGLGVRDREGSLVAVGVSLPGAPGIGFIGLLLTDPARRGEGLGGAITAALAAELRAEGRTPCLFAVPNAVALYERLGFVGCGQLDSYRGMLRCHSGAAQRSPEPTTGLHRWVPGSPSAPRNDNAVRTLTLADIETVISLDRAAYGGDRAALIVDQLSRNPGLAFGAEDEGGLCGFALGAARPGQTSIGPVVAEARETAIALLGALADAVGPGRVRCDRLATESPGAFEMALRTLGLTEVVHCRLMRLGSLPGRVFGNPDKLFAAQSAAAG